MCVAIIVVCYIVGNGDIGRVVVPHTTYHDVEYIIYKHISCYPVGTYDYDDDAPRLCEREFIALENNPKCASGRLAGTGRQYAFRDWEEGGKWVCACLYCYYCAVHE